MDLIDCSSGGILPSIKLLEKEGYNVFISETIKKNVNIMTSVVGYIFNDVFAEKIIEEEKTDMVTIGRALLRDPYWVIKNGLKYRKKFYPVQYERGFNVPKNLM